MAKYLFKVKTKCTLYYDAEEGEWSDEDPRMWNNTCLETLRKGSVLYVIKYDSYYDNSVVLLTKNTAGGLHFKNENEVVAQKDWFEVIENDK